MLVGRDAELRELTAAAATALRDGRSATALVGGDAGIGKTSLVAAVAARLRDDGVTVAWTGCLRDGGTPPYWPWAQLLRELGRPDALDPAATTAVAGGGPELARFRLVEDVATALRAAAPVLLVIDDLHWADRDSLRLLDALGTHVGRAAVLVIGTYRDTEPGAVASVAAERRIVLHGLGPDELRAAVAASTGEAIGDDVAAALHRRTGGNPFFAAEIVRLLRAEGTLHAGPASPLPDGIRTVLDRRLDALAAGTEAVLRAAAVLGAGTTAGVGTDLLAAVADVAPAELAELLSPAVEARLVTPVDGRYRFPHALVAEALSARTPAAERLRSHRRAAAASRDRGGTTAGTARHLVEAATLSGLPEERRAGAAAAEEAARAALAGAAYEDAAGWLESALSLLTDEDGGDRGALLCALGEADLAASARDRARRAFQEAAAVARARGRPDVLAAAALGAAGGAAGFEVDLTDPDRCLLLEEALAALPATDSPVRGAVSARLSVALAFTTGEARRTALADDAVAMGRRLEDPRLLATGLAARCDAIAGPGHVDERRVAADEIVVCARRSGDRAVELLGRRLRVVALAEAGRWPEVDLEIEAYARVAEPLRQPGLTWLVPLWRGARALSRGDADAAARHDAELTDLARRSGSANAELLQLTQRFLAAMLGGRPDEVGIGRFLELAPDLGAAAYCTLALLRAATGEAGAADLLERYLDARAAAPPDSEWLPEMVQAARTAILLDHHAAAATLYATLLPYAHLFAVEGLLAGTWGSVSAHLGRLAALLGDDEAARRHLTDAATAEAGAGAALVARTREWWARVGQAAAPPGAGAAEAVFRRAGEVWTLVYRDRSVQLRDSKGMGDLATLLARPHRDVAVHELIGTPVAAAQGSGPFELADRTSIAAYRGRLLDLAAERDDAEAAHDPVRAARAATEESALLDELAAVTGLGGGPRRAGSDLERMRKAVGNRIRQALARIGAAHPDLGRHLRLSVRTGTFCRYEPEQDVRWQL